MAEQAAHTEAGYVKRLLSLFGGAVSATLWTGYFPLGPGTVGSIVACVLFYFCPYHLRFPLLPGIVLLAWAGCEAGKKLWGDDPSRVTIDEVAGCWVACLAAPARWGIPGILAAFVLFRVFDIAKPWPVCVLDRMKSGLGILLDDLAAGLIAAVILIAAGYFI